MKAGNLFQGGDQMDLGVVAEDGQRLHDPDLVAVAAESRGQLEELPMLVVDLRDAEFDAG